MLDKSYLPEKSTHLLVIGKITNWTFSAWTQYQHYYAFVQTPQFNQPNCPTYSL